MSVATLKGQLEKMRRELPQAGASEEDCPAKHIGAIVCYCPQRGESRPDVDAVDCVPCQTCGGKHTLVICQEIVERDGADQLVPARNAGDAGQGAA
jgi:hypothetical protein